MANETQIEIVLKDEVTGTAQKVHASIKRLREEAKKSTPIGQKALDALERTVQAVGREIKSSITTLGASSAILSGSFITALASIAASLDKFASNSIRQHAVNREIGLTYDQFERLVLAAKARGLSDREARTGVEKLARSVRDLALGTRSSTRDRLEDNSYRDTGTIISQQFQASLQKNGLYNTILEVLGRMRTESTKGNDQGSWAAQAIGDAMGTRGEAWNGLITMLDKFKKVVIPSEEASKKYLLAQRKLGIALSKVRNRITAVLMPSFTKLLKMMVGWFSEDNSKRFAAWLRGVVKALLDFPWDKLRERIDRVLGWVGNELLAIVSDLAAFVESIDGFIQWINRWREKNRGREEGYGAEAGKGGPLVLPEVRIDADQPDATTPQKFSEGDSPLPFRVRPEAEHKFDMSGVLSAANAKIGAQHIEDLRTIGGQDFHNSPSIIPFDSSDDRLTEQVGELAFEMRRFVDVLRDIREGAGGGSSDGGVSQKARTRPMETKAGGAGAPLVTEDQKEAAANPVSRGAVSSGPVPVGPRVVKGSVFGNFTKQLGSVIGWDDPDDKYTSGPLKGQPKPNYGGYGQNVPGIALPYTQAAGKPEQQQGKPVRVWDPRPGHPSVMGRVVDIGPNQINPRSRDKGLDMNAAMAERLGFAPTKKTAQETGRDVFPTGSNFKYQVLRPEDMIRARTEMQHERQRIAGQSIKWHRQGQLDLNVNVDGPKGVKVDAETDGELAGNGSTTNINRGGMNGERSPERNLEQSFAE